MKMSCLRLAEGCSNQGAYGIMGLRRQAITDRTGLIGISTTGSALSTPEQGYVTPLTLNTEVYKAVEF